MFREGVVFDVATAIPSYAIAGLSTYRPTVMTLSNHNTVCGKAVCGKAVSGKAVCGKAVAERQEHLRQLYERRVNGRLG